MNPFITISGDGSNTVEVAYVPEFQNGRFIQARQTVDLGPSPAWPSPTEQAMMIADATHQVMMLSWHIATGEPVCICDKRHNPASCPDHPTCQGAH